MDEISQKFIEHGWITYGYDEVMSADKKLYAKLTSDGRIWFNIEFCIDFDIFIYLAEQLIYYDKILYILRTLKVFDEEFFYGFTSGNTICIRNSILFESGQVNKYYNTLTFDSDTHNFIVSVVPKNRMIACKTDIQKYNIYNKIYSIYDYQKALVDYRNHKNIRISWYDSMITKLYCVRRIIYDHSLYDDNVVKLICNYMI
jgi:hypothetical protein